jgi:hypothetical protein
MPEKNYDSSAYAKIGQSIGALVTSKQEAYGDSFGKSGEVLRLLYPEGITPEKLDDALTVVRVVDKLFRIATARDAFGESPWRDVAGYALLSIERQERRSEKCVHEFGDAHCSKCGALLSGLVCDDFDNRGDGFCRRCMRQGIEHHA